MIRYFYLWSLLLFSFGAMAQSSAILEAYVQEGLQNNLSLKQEGLEIRKVNEAIVQAKSLFLSKSQLQPHLLLGRRWTEIGLSCRRLTESSL